jgi:hypothetical protein
MFLQSQGFNLVSLIIERIGDKIVPFAEKLLSVFPNVSSYCNDGIVMFS